MTQPMTALDLAISGLVEPGDLQAQQQLKLRLDIFTESMVVTRYAEGVPTIAYEVAPDDVASAFSGQPINTGLLPEGCLFYGRSGGQERLAILLPPSRQQVTAEAKGQIRAYAIPLPWLLVLGQGTTYHIWALPRRPSTLSAPLYHAPLPNVRNDGSICVGSVSFPICTPTTIAQAVDLFFESNFNRDLASGKSRAHYEDVLELWAQLEGAETFNSDDLMPAPENLRRLVEGEF